MVETYIWYRTCDLKACMKPLSLQWSWMYLLHMTLGATWGVSPYKQKRKLSVQVLFLKPMTLLGTARATRIRQLRWEIQPTPWGAALTGHVERDNPLSSPGFVDRFTFVQSWHICPLDDKGTHSLWRKKKIPGYKQWRLCLCTCIQTRKFSHPHKRYDLPTAFILSTRKFMQV